MSYQENKRGKKKKRRKGRGHNKNLGREYALKYFGRKPEATDNVLLAILICKEMGWEECETMPEIKAAISLFYRTTKPPPKTKRLKTDAEFYSSSAWKTLRYQALKNTDGMCQCCGAKASDGVQIHVDHIKPRSKHPRLELDLDNLQVLCGDCNVGKDNWDDTNWKQHWDSI